MLQGFIWKYNEAWQTVPPTSVLKVFHPEKATYVKTYKDFGFIPTMEEGKFLKVGDDIPSHIVTPMPLDSDQEGQMEDDSDMDNFVVDDAVANEPFTHAEPTNDFVREVHQAVSDYNGWMPQNKSEEKVKTFIDGLAHKYQHQDDNRQFAHGKSVNYSNPPLRK